MAALVTLAASRSRRWALLVMTAAGFAMSRSWLYLPAGAALGLALASTFQRRAYRRMGALTGALGVQLILRWPPAVFHGFTAVIAVAAAVPVLASGWSQLSDRARTTALKAVGAVGILGALLTLPVIISALVARGPADQGTALARASLQDVEAGQSPAAAGELRKAASDMAAAHLWATGWWNLGGYVVPGVAQQERAMYWATKAGQQLTRTAAGEAESLNFSALRYRNGHVDLAAVKALAGPARTLETAVGTARATLGHAPNPWLIGPLAHKISNLGGDLNRAGKATDVAVAGIRAAPGLLGGEGTRHYLVAVMTPAEARGLGGFLGAYAELTVSGGSIQLTTSGRATALVPSPPPPGLHLAGPAPYLARYGRFHPEDHFEDLTYSPDFPTVEEVMAQLYPQVGGGPIDGALVLDPYSLADLLRFTGPIPIPGLGVKLTSANAADILLRQQYLLPGVSTDQRHDLLQDALSVGFRRLTTGSLPSPKDLSTALAPDVREGRLVLWTGHPSDQPFLERLGLTGTFPKPGGGDLLAVTLSNSGNSKIDAYLHQTTDDSVRYDPASGHVSSKVTVRFTNSAPSSGMPDYVIGSYADSGLPPGTSYLWVSLYSPLHLARATLAGQPVELSPGQSEDGVSAYSTYVVVPAGATAVLTVSLDGQLMPGPTYRLTTRLQPLANPQTLSVAVDSVSRSSAPVSWQAGSAEIQSHLWTLRKS